MEKGASTSPAAYLTICHNDRKTVGRTGALYLSCRDFLPLPGGKRERFWYLIQITSQKRHSGK
jgi:hypothetical protein